MKTVLSLGAGVQSSTLALMCEIGQITPKPDLAVFADTQAEPQEVYDWLARTKNKIGSVFIAPLSKKRASATTTISLQTSR